MPMRTHAKERIVPILVHTWEFACWIFTKKKSSSFALGLYLLSYSPSLNRIQTWKVMRIIKRGGTSIKKKKGFHVEPTIHFPCQFSSNVKREENSWHPPLAPLCPSSSRHPWEKKRGEKEKGHSSFLFFPFFFQCEVVHVAIILVL